MSDEIKQPLLSMNFGRHHHPRGDPNVKERIFTLFSDEESLPSSKPKSSIYPPNVIVSSRYTLINFLPKSLLEQFRRLANVYFLVIGIIALIGSETSYFDSAIEPAGILAPMMIVVFISIIKEGIEDFKRHQADARVNNRLTHGLAPDGTIFTKLWKDIQVGDVLVVFADEELPADVLVLMSGGISGKCCYVETAAIDGETNLKMKVSSLAAIHHLSGADTDFEIPSDRSKVVGSIESLRCTIKAELPTPSIHKFSGSVQPPIVDVTNVTESSKQVALNEKNLMLRGSILRATEWCICTAVYTGADTKLSMNSKRPPSKLSSIDRIVNRTLVVSITCMIFVCIVSMIFGIIWESNENDASYLCLHEDDLKSSYPQGGGCESAYPTSGLTFFTFATLYNNFVCISMYVSLEMVYICQSYFLCTDLEVYDEATDTPAECNSSGMCADLGQVQYVLSDKTGTLTKNQMIVQCLSICNRVYGQYNAGGSESEIDTPKGKGPEGTSEYYSSISQVQTVGRSLDGRAFNGAPMKDFEKNLMLHFMRVLVYCNTGMIMPGSNENDQANNDDTIHDAKELEDRLQAESPDEVALILAAAQHCGVLLRSRSSHEIVSQGLGKYFSNPLPGNVEERVEILAVNEFDSDRKMMSILIRVLNSGNSGEKVPNKIYLLCKGADSSILRRCADIEGAPNAEYCKAHINLFANTGLRTLAAAYREVSQEELSRWLAVYEKASTVIAGRSEAMQKAAEDIEQNMILLGALGIEDELQDGVPEAISLMHAAGINVWMITGDKAETAIAIGKKCALVKPEKHQIERVLNLADNSLRERILELHQKVLSETRKHVSVNSNEKELALIVDGISLDSLWNAEDLRTKFVEIVQFVPVVIACRVSPLQKAALVRMVKTAPGNPVTLGIGDGANDVGMIHESRVGVGISGREGRHAANAADFAVAQFRFITNLLFYHGRYNYIRCSKLVLYSFYKNLLLVSVLFYYCAYSGFSGTIPLDSIVFSGFNFYLGLPVLAIGAMDFDVPRSEILKFPYEAYATGRLGEMLNIKSMAKWCVFAFIQGLILFVVTTRFVSGPTWVFPEDGYWTFDIFGTGLNQVGSGSELGLYAGGLLIYTTIIVAMQYKVVVMSVTPNFIFWAVWILSFCGYFLFIWLYGVFPSVDWFNVTPLAFNQPLFWLSIVIVPILLVISDYAADVFWQHVDPSSRDVLLEKLRSLERTESARVSTEQQGIHLSNCPSVSSNGNLSKMNEALMNPTTSPLTGELNMI